MTSVGPDNISESSGYVPSSLFVLNNESYFIIKIMKVNDTNSY